ncbi:MAG TPA: glycosyltransferase family 1 protein [Opitutaceae bacterium]|nr:glycosyltransferase family 1 protein [Opitutaceae bacterium]
MKVLLVGNLPDDRQESMRRFTELLHSGLTARGHHVTQLAPRLRIARLAGAYRYGGISKYLGYLDKFALFPRQLRKQIKATRPDVVHITDHANASYARAAGTAPVLITCHDLLQVRAALGEIPQQRVSGLGRRYQAWILRSLAQAPRLACVSSKTREEVLRLTTLPPALVSVVPNALNHPYRPLDHAVARERVAELAAANQVDPSRLSPGKGGFLLNVGGAHWYKNRAGLLAIYAELRRRLMPTPALVMVGPPLSSEDAARVATLGLSEQVILFSSLTNDQLEGLYGLAEGLIFPSWEEGFGWPIAEAQACGCPVFTSNRAPMNEVGGSAGVYFDPADPADAARLIAAAWPNRAAQRARGFEEVRRWDPAAMFAGYEKIYRELAARKR